jgi:hypothetical protein
MCEYQAQRAFRWKETLMELADRLCTMIRAHQMVMLRAREDPDGEWREVEPHAVYIGSNERGFVDFYQRGGFSRSGKLPGWRRLGLLDVIALQPVDSTFEPREDYRPENRTFYRAFVCTATDAKPGDAPFAPPGSADIDESINPT